jgi:hypothetical protein
MARTVISLLIAVASGLVLLAVTWGLQLFDPTVRVLAALGLGITVAFVAILVSRRTRRSGRREVASNIRARRDVTIEGLRVKGGMHEPDDSSTASGIRAKGSVNIRDIDEGRQ